MKKQYVSLLAVILSVSGFLFSCHDKMNKNTGALQFDSIQVNETAHLFNDTAKPACNIIVNFAYPVKSSDDMLKDSLNAYFISACCVEACRRNYRCKFVDYSDLLDELIVLNRQKDLNRYRKRIKYYARIQLLFIDDFAISRYSEEGIKILYHLIKLRDDLGTSTLFTCQYSPDEWGNQLSDEKECYGKLDGIRRRLTTGFTVLIEKA